MADVKAKAKWRSYDASLASQASGGRGWLCDGKSKSTDEFVPFAFEIGGALGTEAEAFMREAVKVAEFCRKGQGDLQHWSAMSWRGHWSQRIGVEIVRSMLTRRARHAVAGVEYDPPGVEFDPRSDRGTRRWPVVRKICVCN